MKYIVVLALLAVSACGKKSEPGAVCASYVSPYMVVYPDQSVKKSTVANCSDGLLKVSALDQSGAVFSSSHLIVRESAYDGSVYFTDFVPPTNGVGLGR